LELVETPGPPPRQRPAETARPVAAPPPRAPESPDDIDLFPEDRAPPPAPVVPQRPTIRQDDDSAPANLDDDDDEIRVEVPIAPPVERLEHRPVIKMPKPDAPEDKDDGSEVDFGKIKKSIASFFPAGDSHLPPEIAGRKPFTLKSILVFLGPGIIGRCVVLTLLVIGELWAIGFVTDMLARSHETGGIEAAMGQIAALLIYVPAFAIGIFTFVVTAMFCFTIVQDTANGQDKIESWPEMSLWGWVEATIYFGAAFLIGGMPGALLSAAVSTLGFWVQYWLTPLFLVASLVLLFPPVLISMLESGSVMEPMSRTMLQSYSPLRRFWMQFYALGLAIGFVAVVIFNFCFLRGWFTMLPGAALLTVLPFIYFRLLGRMAMMYRDYVAAITPDEEDDGPVVRHVIQ
jgi:hypothetical protein